MSLTEQIVHAALKANKLAVVSTNSIEQDVERLYGMDYTNPTSGIRYQFERYYDQNKYHDCIEYLVYVYSLFATSEQLKVAQNELNKYKQQHSLRIFQHEQTTRRRTPFQRTTCSVHLDYFELGGGGGQSWWSFELYNDNDEMVGYASEDEPEDEHGYYGEYWDFKFPWSDQVFKFEGLHHPSAFFSQ